MISKKTLSLTAFIVTIFYYSANFACSGFVIEKNSKVFAGHNNDFFNVYTKMWFVPPSSNQLGRIYFGKDDYYPVSGMNQCGLVMEHFSAREKLIKKSIGKPDYDGNIFDKIMAECSTVDDVISILEKYYLDVFHNGMVMFCDQSGNSIIVEGDTIIHKSGDYQICTNIYQSEYKKGNYPCKRYNLAEKMIGELPDAPSIENYRDILNAVHQDITQLSVLYDLSDKIVYVYHFHDYDNFIRVNFEEELKMGAHSFDLPKLFPPNKEFEKTNYGKIIPQNNAVVTILLILFGIFYVFTLILFPSVYSFRKRETKETGTALTSGSANIISATSRLFIWILSLLSIIYLLALHEYPQLFYIGMPEDLGSLLFIEKLLLHIPVYVIVLFLLSSFFIIAAIKKKIWTTFYTRHIIVFSIVTITTLVLYAYWGFIRFYF